MGEKLPPRNNFDRIMNFLNAVIDVPIDFVREKIVEPNRKTYNWYHHQFRRVPTIDECYTDDMVCFTEANEQFKRDMQVDSAILGILRQRNLKCLLHERPDVEKCAPLREIYEEAAANWFCKYGDLGHYGDVKTAYFKQKHRMVWERRHGPVGSGMKDDLSV